MKVLVLEEAGFKQALLGLSLNKNQRVERVLKVADKLAPMGGGHNKFLESISVWLDIDAPRYWWSQFDTYRVGVTKQSESTMHTLMKRNLIPEDFADGLYMYTEILDVLNDAIDRKDFERAKNVLPESFLQRRIVCTNYKALRNIVHQRKDHRLSEWQDFVFAVTTQVTRPEWITK